MEGKIAEVRRIRTQLQVGYDAAAWSVSFLAMAALQALVGYSSTSDVVPALAFGIGCGLVYALVGATVHLHQGRSSIGSFADAVLATLVWAITALTGLLVDLAGHGPVRVSVAVTAPMCALMLILGVRAAYRIYREWAIARGVGPRLDLEPVVVIGAGKAAAQLITAMRNDPRCPWRPVALVDDDPYKRRRRLGGVPVVARATDFVEVAGRYSAKTAILAIPSASAQLVKDFNRAAVAGAVDLKVLPSVNDLSNPARVQIEDVRDIDVTDFLGRQPVDTDVDSIASYLTGKRVLVTGAGGSIGSELCRQIHRFGPSELVMLDRDESALHAVQLSIQGRALLDSDDIELGDIRDRRFVQALFERRKPDVVFHAAALKHLPLLEAAPGEAVKTNIWGTQTVLEAAVAAGVERFVNVSTDKAANPCSVLGYSKRLAEGLTSNAARDADGKFMSVRFGNVLGSRGSVLTAFTAQIAKGGPVTVTDPGVTRYFMTIREAVQLVIQAGALGSKGDVLVLDMGAPVSIKAMAEQLIDLSGQSVEVVYTGLRDGEKLHEELFDAAERDIRPDHPLISHAAVPPYTGAMAGRFNPYKNPELITLDLAAACSQMASWFRGMGDLPAQRLEDSGVRIG